MYCQGEDTCTGDNSAVIGPRGVSTLEYQLLALCVLAADIACERTATTCYEGHAHHATTSIQHTARRRSSALQDLFEKTTIEPMCKCHSSSVDSSGILFFSTLITLLSYTLATAQLKLESVHAVALCQGELGIQVGLEERLGVKLLDKSRVYSLLVLLALLRDHGSLYTA